MQSTGQAGTQLASVQQFWVITKATTFSWVVVRENRVDQFSIDKAPVGQFDTASSAALRSDSGGSGSIACAWPSSPISKIAGAVISHNPIPEHLVRSTCTRIRTTSS
jgi:hypothetical protein